MKLALAAALSALALAGGAQAQTAPPVGVTSEPCAARTPQNDWANVCKYRAENAALPAPRAGQPRVVFMGDSITESWRGMDGAFFEQNGYVGRGISGQTTPQMLVRFMPDVIALKPAAVHIMAGTNDVAGNTGPTTLEAVQNNIRAMATLARAHGAKVILASIPPALDFPWRKGMEPGPKVAALNAWLKAYAAREGFTYVDYWPAIATPGGDFKPGLASDGIHPTLAGYKAMEPLTQAAIARALNSKR
jgi:lysophospholipase L1-like esterase